MLKVKSILSALLKGVVAFIPLAITVYLLVWFFIIMEDFFGDLFKWIMPQSWYFPGVGIIVGIICIFLLGLILQTWFAKKIQILLESIIKKIPIISDVYIAIKGLFDYITGKQTPKSAQVVMVELGADMKVMGLVTCEDLSQAPKGLANKKDIAVYLPMSYQLGGYTVYLPRNKVKPVDMNKKTALRWTLMGGIADDQPPK